MIAITKWVNERKTRGLFIGDVYYYHFILGGAFSK
jgi:hypothetical protein